MSIHPTAIIHETAILGENVQIGPYTLIGEHVQIGSHCVLAGHVVIEAGTILGEYCQVASGAVLGGPPQDLAYKGEATRVRIGAHSQIREYVTINRATGEGTETVLGEHCFLMAYSHVGHNCQLGQHVILANLAQLGGHAQIGDYVFIGGNGLVHQHCRIGKMAFLGGSSSIRQDIAPFTTAEGRAARTVGLNIVGLRRRGLTSIERNRLKKAFTYLWLSGMNQKQAIELIQQTIEMDSNIQDLINFITSSKRGICGGKVATERTLDPEPEPAFA